MNLARLAVRRPVFATMAGLIVIVLGLVSLTRLKTDLLPAVELPTLSVRTTYGGASPEVMERRVTQIVEEIVATVPGVEEISSTSSQSYSDVRVRFGYDVDPDTAALDLQGRIEDESDELPDDVDRPRVNKFDVNAFPVVILGIASDLDPVELTTLVEEDVRRRISRVPGVAQVDPWGGYTREVQVELDPDKLKALRLPMNGIVASLRDANLDLPAGEIEQGQYDVTLRAPGEFGSVDDIRQVVVAVNDGAAVTLGQVATVSDTYQRLWRTTRVNGRLGLRVGVRKAADANTVDVANGILAEIEAINRDMPQVEIIAVGNQGNFIERSIANVARSVAYGGALAVLVLLFFLRNLRSTFIVAAAIPISIIATFALVYFGGFTLNLMTLGGLALGVGMMVDNSIVVLENIYRRRDEEGEAPKDAAINGAGEVAGAIVASTITTLVIFLPLAFVRGVSGVLFGALGMVVVFSLACSLAVSLSLVPMLASRLLGRKETSGPRTAFGRRLLAASDRLFARLEGGYREVLGVVLRHRWATVLSAAALLVSSLLLYPFIGSEFLPPSDEGQVNVNARLDTGTRMEVVDEQVRRIEELVVPMIPELRSYVTNASGGNGGLDIDVGPAGSRTRTSGEIADDVRRRLEGAIPGAELGVWAPQGQFILERVLGGNQEGVEVEVRGYDLATLEALTDRVADAAEQIEGVTDVRNEREGGAPEQTIQVDRRKAADLGLSVRDVAQVIETAVAGADVGDYREGGNSYQIQMRLADAERLPLSEILDLTVRTPAGGDVALRNVVEITPGVGPTRIARRDQQRVATVNARVSGRDLGSVAEDLAAAIATIPRPAGYSIEIGGNIEEQEESRRELLIGMGMALLLVFMVLACQYESLRDPLIVMASVPTAAVGVLLILYLTETTFNVQSYIGCIMLGGIVVNNAILLVDQAGQLRRGSGLTAREAVAEAGRRRLRPILMTTLTTLLGLVPLALGVGEGADAQAPLARAVLGGLTAGTVITLVLIPAVYSLAHPERQPRRAVDAGDLPAGARGAVA